MFKNILVPTDGSKLSAKGIKAGVRLARALGAKVTGMYVVLPYTPPLYNEAALYYIPGLSPLESKKIYEGQAKAALGRLHKAAKSAGVRCQSRIATSGHPWQAMLRTARAEKCDAIVMASHGRSGFGGAILGSETTRVLANSRIPVLVVR